MTSSPSTIDAKVRDGLSDGSLAGTWHLDGARSSVRMSSKTFWGLVTVRGRFTNVSGEAVISPTGEVTGSLRVASGSVDTRNKKRDTHLRSADFFNSEVHPEIVFTVDRADVTSEGASAAGTLEVAGQKRPLEVPVSATATAEDTLELDVETQIDRSDFGLTWNQLGMVSMKSLMTIHAVFTRG